MILLITVSACVCHWPFSGCTSLIVLSLPIPCFLHFNPFLLFRTPSLISPASKFDNSRFYLAFPQYRGSSIEPLFCLRFPNAHSCITSLLLYHILFAGCLYLRLHCLPPFVIKVIEEQNTWLGGSFI